MDRKRLQELAEKYYKKAEEAYQAYQETGIRRYDTQRRNNEELGDAMKAAANAADEHNDVIAFRYTISRLATIAKKVDEVTDDKAKVKMLNMLKDELITEAKWRGI